MKASLVDNGTRDISTKSFDVDVGHQLGGGNPEQISQHSIVDCTGAKHPYNIPQSLVPFASLSSQSVTDTM